MSENEKFTQQELQEFSEKLEAWGESLSAREQMLLTVLLERSEEESEENDDVEGFAVDSNVTQRSIKIHTMARLVSRVLRNRMSITAQPGVEIQNGLLANNPTAVRTSRGKYTGNSTRLAPGITDGP